MHRIAVITISVVLTILVVIASFMGALYLSWINAKEAEKDKLYTISDSAIRRTRLCLDQIYNTFDVIDKSQMNPCSAEQIKLFRDLTFSHNYIDDIQYLENDVVKCSALQIGNNQLSIPSNGYEIFHEIKIIPNLSSVYRKNGNYIALRRNNYSIIVNANKFTDIIVNPYIKIALLTNDGQILSTMNSPNPALLSESIKDSTGENNKQELIAVRKLPFFTVIVSEANKYVLKSWEKQNIIFIPLGFMMALILSSIIIYFSKRRLSFIGEIKLAIENRELVVYYQPLIDFATGRCVGAEALIRWLRPDGKMINPDVFIPLAEEAGLIHSITVLVIENVIVDMKKYLIEDKELHISINIAAEDFNSGSILATLESNLQGTNIQPQQIWLEITERSFMDIDSCREKIFLASKKGFPIVIDDFGTGYSGLSYLQGLPLDVLKIDKSFVDTVDTDSVTSHVTTHIISLAKSLRLKMIAEGVETKLQADYLASQGVEYAQGWYYAKAMSSQDFIDFYTKTNSNLKKVV